MLGIRVGLLLQNVSNSNILQTRKHWQSYRHADPRLQQQHTAVARVYSNRATVAIFVTMWPWPLIF